MKDTRTDRRIMTALQAALGDAVLEAAPDVKAAVLARLVGVVESEIDYERARCVEVCRARAEVWENTLMSQSPLPSAREETRARANEARFLADALAMDEPAPTDA